jgi:hypothetical protein
MRAAPLVLAIAATAFAVGCGSKNPGTSICDNTVPAPDACQSTCDPKPGAPNTCPGGYHCAEDGFCDAVCTQGGNECGDGYKCTPDGRCVGEDACEGLECNIADCVGQGKPETQIKGTVFAPNGTLPLYGITVYIPNQALPPMPDGAQCSRCSDDLPGLPLARATTDESGNFTITGNVPAGSDIPLVITSGKWRRQVTIPAVAACGDTSLPAELTRLPKNRSEGDIPKIALSTGAFDSLECLLRRIGIDDSEIGTNGGDQRIQLYSDVDSAGKGVSAFKAGFPGGTGNFTNSKALWNNLDTLKSYDIVILSCEGGQYATTKKQTDMDNLKAYADFGGRVFLSHWHNVWISGDYTNSDNGQSPAVWGGKDGGIATWTNGTNFGNAITDVIDEVNNPKGKSFADWMKGVEPANPRGEIPIKADTGRATSSAIKPGVERWTTIKGSETPQNFQFTTPFEAPADQRCGKVVYSDMHVSGGPDLGKSYPDSCGDGGTPAAMSAQEKALAFMLFDLASCVGVLL